MFPSGRLPFAAAALVGVCAGLASASPAFRKPITLDHTRVSGSADLTEFPLLVSIANDPNLQANVASPLGHDIQFRAADGVTILAHEIERYDPASGTLVAWVRVPRLRFDLDTVLYLYYGDPAVTCALGSGASVWDSGFVGVWHLAQDPSLAAPQVLDSTGFANHGTSAGGMTAGDLVSGKIGRALDFDGVNDLVNAGSAFSIDDLGPLTLSAWIRPRTAGGSSAGIVASKYDASPGRWLFETDGTGPELQALEFNKNFSTGQTRRASSNGVVAYNAWQHVAVTWSGSELGTTVHIYKDGVEVSYQATGSGTPPPASDAALPLILGNRATALAGFDGVLDEIRLSRIVRSPDWLLTEFRNQDLPTKNAACNDGGFACIGAQQGVPGGFTNVSAASGLATGGNKDGGLAWGDFDGDGCLDVLVNTDSNGLGSRLYRQNGAGACAGTFTDVTACLAPALASSRLERSALWGDIDNDGDLDFIRNTTDPIEIYRNNGPGASGCGVSWSVFGAAGSPSQVLDSPDLPFAFNSEGLGLMDYDADGDLDLFTVQGGPIAMFSNSGGTFSYVAVPGLPTAASINADYSSVADLDVDGDVDILARRIGTPDLFLNSGNLGTFTAGAFDQLANNGNKGGTAFCDFDDDGDFDLFWSDAGTNQVWEQTGVGSGTFAARAVPAGIGSDIDGVSCGDIDNDSDLDLALSGTGNDLLYRNDGGFTFTNVSPAAFGANDGEANAFGDYDRDGDLDLLINQDTANQLWRNETNNNNYLVVRALHDTGTAERDAIGATLRLLDCGLNPVSGVREVNGGQGHGSQNPAPVHFGLPSCGAASGPNSRYVVEARFVGGTVVRKSIVPSSLAGYQMVSIRDTDADDLLACTTAVDLVSFDARPGDGEVVLDWETGSELENLGFHLYRGESAAGPFHRVTTSLVPALGSSVAGAKYQYVDRGLENDRTYYYELEDVESTGRLERHGPVSAVPRRNAPAVSRPAGGEEGALPARVVFGDPSRNELRVIRRSPREIVVELRTDGFHATPLSDGTVRIELPGALLLEGETLPVRRESFEVDGTGIEVLSTHTEGVQSFGALELASGGGAELVMHRSGAVRLLRRARPNDRGVKKVEETASLVELAYQGDTAIARIDLRPFRWDPERRRLWLARRLRVRLRVSTASFSRRSPWERIPPRSARFHLAATESGLHRVRFEDLFPVRHRSLQPSELRLGRQGEAVPYWIEPRPDRFGAGSTLFFLSAGAEANPFGKEVVYELEIGKPGVGMQEEDASPKGPQVGSYRHRLEREENRLYQATLLDRDDPWLWETVVSGSRNRYPLQVHRLVEGPARLAVFLHGGSDSPASPDHHVRVWLNGALVGSDRWNAKRARIIDGELPADLLHEGENVLEIENAGDTGAPFSVVYLDRLELTYPRALEAIEGRLEGSVPGSGSVSVSGLGSKPLLLDVTDAPRWLTGGVRASGGDFRFSVEADRSYVVVASEAARVPEIRRPKASTLVRESNRADYVVIGPKELLGAAAPLTALREKEGLYVVAAPLEEIASSFGHGESGPEAIRSFLSFAYHSWRKPSPRYVLLVGDGTYDFKDHLQAGGSRDRLPPYLIRDRFLWTASDARYAAVNGSDEFPDMAIGRLPAATVEELTSMVAKILAYESEGRPAGDGPVVLVADDPDGAGDFESDAEALSREVLAGREVQRIDLRRLGPAETRSRIRDGFESGPELVSYLGHGGIDLWADERILRSSDVASFHPSGRLPLVLTMNCLNGYFHFPYFDSLGEALVKAEDRGAVAAFSPSGLSLHASAHRYQEILLRKLQEGRYERLGDAILAAQRELGDPELIRIYHLFGDPALSIRSR